MCSLPAHGARGWLIGTDTIVTVATRETLTFGKEAEGILSLFCLGAAVRDLTIRGLHYPLERGTLTPDFPLGVSNHFTGQASTVSVGEGLLLAMWDRANSLPGRSAYADL